MAQLSASELRKYDWRPEVFIRKLQEQSSFEISGGQKVILVAPKNAEKILRSGSVKELNDLKFDDTEGNIYKLTDFVKNQDFGGKGERGGTIKEDKALSSLRDQIEEAKKKQKSSTINVKIKNKTYKVYDAVSTPGTPKSDFHLLNVNGEEVVWISHKDGRTEKDFQQWGGMSQKSEPAIYSHQEVQSFIKDLKNLYPDGLPNATTLARKIKDDRLKNMSVYGNEFGGSHSRQNVTITLQGNISLTQSGQNYELTAYHTHVNGEELRGGYEPCFMAIFKGDRSDFGVKGTRIVIAPIGSRKITNFI
jgi:hypothetical protein